MKSEIIRLEEELRQAMMSNDVQKLDDLIEAELVFIAPNGNVATKQMDLESHKSKIQKMTRMEPSEQHVLMKEDCAIVSVRMKIAGTFGEVDISGDYRYLRVWSKANDSWKISAGCVARICDF